MPIDKTKADRLIEVYNFLTGLVEGKRDVEPLQLKDGTILYRDEVGQSDVDTIPVEEAEAAVGPEMINLVEATETQQNGASRRRRNGKSTRARWGTRKQRRNRK